MNKMKKRFLSLLLAITMLFSVTATAFADDPAPETPTGQIGTIKICGTEAGKQYDLYRVFDLTHSQGHFYYTINPYFVDFFKEKNGGTAMTDAQAIAFIESLGSNSEALSKLARELVVYAIAKPVTATTVAGAAGNTTVINMPYGYYLLNPLGGFGPNGNTATMFSLGTLSGEQGDCTINLKALYPTVDKNIVKGTNRVKTTDAAIGDTINYELNSTAPDVTGYTTYTYKFTDTMSKGLTFNSDSVKIKVGGVDATVGDINNDFTVTYSPNPIVAGTETTITITANNAATLFAGKAGQTVVVTYSAKLNEHAVIGSTGNPNSVVLEYSNDPKDENSKGTTPPSKTIVYTTALDIEKYFNTKDEEGNTVRKPLKDAGFTLYKVDENNNETAIGTELITNEDGKLTFNGLESGTYKLKETTVPNGFRPLDDITIVITAVADDNGVLTGKFTFKIDNGTESGALDRFKLEIENISGNELPGTGGMGTTIFYTLGLALVVGSGVAFAIKRKRNI